MNNPFLDAMTTVPTASTANGALAYGHTGDFVLDRFSNLNEMFESYEDVSDSLEKAWSENPLLTLRLIMYSRAITRKSELTDLDIKGLGLKNVGRLSLKWLYLNHRDVFLKNLIGIVEIGSYQDLWHKDFVDVWVKNKDQNVVAFLADKVLKADPLALKYLPRYKSTSNINRAKADSNREYKVYRNKGLKLIAEFITNNISQASVYDLMKMKSQGKAHQFQRLITKGKFNSLNFDTLPGKVLTWITKDSPKTNDSFLSRHNLEDSYISWLETQTSLKTTSYLYELISPCIGNNGWYCNSWNEPNKVARYTIEKQVQGLLNQAKESNLNVMPVLDTSGSMTGKVGNTTALNVAMSLAVYFSMIQSGSFKDAVIAFDTTSQFKRLTGSYLTRIKDILKDQDYMGSTDFQSVIKLILNARHQFPEIPVEDYPDVYLVISDMQFNDTRYSRDTNHAEAVKQLKQVGLPEPLFVWYNVSEYGNDNFQNHKNDSGVIHISGFDPAVVNRLMSCDFQLKFEEKHNKSIKEITPLEAMTETLEQDYLKLFVL